MAGEELTQNLFEDLIKSVSTGNAATTHASLEAAFKDAKAYCGLRTLAGLTTDTETRPGQTAQAAEDARRMVRATAAKANDGDVRLGEVALTAGIP